MGAFAGAAGSAPQKKIYTVAPASQSGPALGGTLTWELGNASTGPFTIGSAEIRLTSAFSGFAIESVDPPATLDGTVIKLRNIAVNPGDPPLEVTTHYTAPCSGGTTSWVAEAKQSNDFLGTNNNFLSGGIKLTSVTAAIDACAYKLVFASQPADAGLASATASQAVTTEAGKPAGAAVQVWAVRPDAVAPFEDDIVPVDGASVSVSAVPVSGTGTYSGSFSTEDGIATLTNVVIETTGPDSPLGAYKLRATGGTVGGPAESGEFSVVTKVCPHDGTSADECQADLTVAASGRGTLTYTATAVDLDDSTSSQGATSLSLLAIGAGPPAECGSGFAPLGPGGVQIDTRPLAGKLSVTVAISKLDRQYTQNNGLSQINICIATNLPFTTRNGALSSSSGNEWIGVIPDCPATTDLTGYGGAATEPSPCMVSRQSVGGGAVLVFELPNVGLTGTNGLEAYDPRIW
jgi:hypothetical protein